MVKVRLCLRGWRLAAASGRARALRPSPATTPAAPPTPLHRAQTPAGDQPADIERQVREMWMSYISRPDAIILAVAPAAQDIFADEAIKTALAVDPEGDRTVGACRGRRCARRHCPWPESRSPSASSAQHAGTTIPLISNMRHKHQVH